MSKVPINTPPGSVKSSLDRDGCGKRGTEIWVPVMVVAQRGRVRRVTHLSRFATEYTRIHPSICTIPSSNDGRSATPIVSWSSISNFLFPISRCTVTCRAKAKAQKNHTLESQCRNGCLWCGCLVACFPQTTRAQSWRNHRIPLWCKQRPCSTPPHKISPA